MDIEIKHIVSFLALLDEYTHARALRLIGVLSEFGYEVRMPYSKYIHRDLYELRILGNPQIRIFYTFVDKKIILLHGFIKKTQDIPRREIKNAEQFLKIYKKGS